MKKLLAMFAMTGILLMNASAGELFPDRRPVEIPKGTPLVSGSTIGGYPIYQGDGGWRLLDMNLRMTNAGADVTAVPLGIVGMDHIEPDGRWFASQQVIANLATTGTNQYTVGSPCSGPHLITLNKVLRYGDNCVTVDVEKFQSRSEWITYFSLVSTQTRGAGRRFYVYLQLNAELLGFPGTTPSDWTVEAVENVPSRKAFVERLQRWAAAIQDASARAAEIGKPQSAFDSVPSFRSLVVVPADPAIVN